MHTNTDSLSPIIPKDTPIDYWSICKRRWQPAVCVCVAISILNALHVLSKIPIYQANGLLRLNIENEASQLIGLEELGKLTGQDSSRTMLTEIDVMSSKPLLQQTLSPLRNQLGVKNKDSIFGSPPLQDEVSILKAFLTIVPKAETDIVNVTFEHSEPRVAKAVVNQLMETYVSFNLQENRSKALAGRKFLAQQLPQVKQKVLVADGILRQFMEENNINDLEGFAEVLTTGQVNIQTQLDAVQTEIAKAEAESHNIRRKLGVNTDTALTLSAVSQLPAIQEARQRLQEVGKDLALAQANLTADHPAIFNLQEQQLQLQESLKTTIQTATAKEGTNNSQQPVDPTRQTLLNNLVELSVTRQGLLRQQQVLTVQRDLYRQRSDQLPAVGQKLRQLQRDLVVAETTYTNLLKGLQGAQLNENQTIPTAKIVETAELPTVPVAPNKVSEIVRGIIAGAFLGAGLAYFLEKIDSKLKTVDSIRDAYPAWPVLGSVPLSPPDPDRLLRLPTIVSPRSPISESYRMLQANLRFLKTDSPVRIITLSSALPQEGKSWTVSNLAVVLSQMAHRVLLIDADLRKPTQHQIWEIDNNQGLSNVLTNPDAQNKGILPCHTVQPNLDVLTAGSLPPNPQALVDSQRFQEFLVLQAHQYDFVLIDSPPLTAAADALVMAKAANGLLLVARPEYLTQPSAKRARELLEQFDTDVLGLFINGIVTRNETDSYYYYSKSYYGNSEVEKQNISASIQNKIFRR